MVLEKLAHTSIMTISHFPTALLQGIFVVPWVGDTLALSLISNADWLGRVSEEASVVVLASDKEIYHDGMMR